MKIIEIVRKADGKVVARDPITLGGALGQSDQEYFDIAWENAKSDRAVDPGEKIEDFTFKVID